MTAVFFGSLAAFLPIGPLLDVTVAGTFLACIVVHVGVLVRRRSRPDIDPRFVAPLGPVVPVLGIGFCAYLLYSLGRTTLLITGVILATAAVLYVVRFGSRAVVPSCWRGGPDPRPPDERPNIPRRS
jgi:APA family basic amino acid/polyamine antiporter